jgi:outer membrane receptor protein involved in Fe transport
MRDTLQRWLIVLFLVVAVDSAQAQDPAASADPTAPESRDATQPAPETPAANADGVIEQPAETVPVIPIDNPTDQAPTALDEVVVTATRRRQRINTVPVAVSEVSGSRLESGLIRDTRSLQMEVPSLNIAVSGSEIGGSTIRIRGIGTSGSNPGFESSVGVFVDGVYLPRPGLVLNDLVDVERIEVLRGPQGTLFGKNTSVGAINILTRAPSAVPEAELTATVGNLGTKIARGMVGGGLGDAVQLRLAGQYNQQDGYVHNLSDGQDYNDRDRYLLRAQGVLKATDKLSLRLIGDYIHKDEHCCATPYTLYGDTAAQIENQGGTVFDPVQDYTVAFDHETSSFVEEKGGALQASWDLDGMELRGQLSYREGDFAEKGDGDKNDLDLVRQPFTRGINRLETAELSLHGGNGWLDWLAGAFASKEKVDVSSSILFGEDTEEFLLGTLVDPTVAALLHDLAGPVIYAPDSGQTLTTANQDAESWSLFTHNVLQLGAGFDLTLGLRYLEESKEGGGETQSNSTSCNPTLQPVLAAAGLSALRQLCAAPPYHAEFDDDRLTWTTALGKSFSGGRYTYLSYSSGFKAGGVNLSPPTTISGNYTFLPEEIESYELGFKLPFFGGKVNTRTAVFYMDLTNFQISAYDGTTFIVSNAADVQSQGVEFEGSVSLLENLKLRGGFTWADTTYGDGTADPNLRGKQLTNAPEWVGQLGADWQQPLPWDNTVLFANVVARYMDEVNTGADLNPAKVQEGYTVVNARLGVHLPFDFQVSLWGANLTDEAYHLVIFNAPAQTGSFNGSISYPRTYGLEVRKHFYF